MRVLLISHTCQSRVEGQPKAAQLAAWKGLDLRVLVPDRWYEYGRWRRAEAPEGAAYAFTAERVALPWTGPAQWYLHWYPRLAAILREFRPHIIDIWEEPYGLVSAQTCWLRNRILPQTKILSETEQNINKNLPLPFERCRAYTLRNADFAVGRNAEAVAVLRSKGFTGPAAVVPNAVDADLFRPMERAACRAELGYQPTDFVAGYVGRLVESKGLMEAVDALPHCPGNVRLLFVGAGDFKTDLEERARDLGVSERVRFLPARPLTDLPKVMNALDTLLLVSRTTPSWKEQFGRVVIEANACGTPVIGSRSGAIPEVVGNAGLIVPEKDPVALAAAIRDLADNPHRRNELGAIGRAQVEAKFTWARVADQMHDIYSQILDSKCDRP
ncbi:MAG: glycosyltransferase [Armatimonadetes bacterium]|nr:glycosyltransferase [Armatimonadota bacterium]